MTTAAQALPALEVSAPDADMDVLSDAGFDFGDGDSDIDIDLDTAPSVNDEDMSLNDAATDGGIEIQELPADQDDHMADNGDLIEEDDIYTGDDATGAASQPLDDGTVALEADMLAPPDEDLIDYSDDEALQPVKMQSPSVHGAEEDFQVAYEDEPVVETPHAFQEDVHIHEQEQPITSVEASREELPRHQEGIVEPLVRHETSPSTSSEHQSQSVAELQLESHDQEHAHTDDKGGVQLPAEETSHSDEDGAAEQQENADHKTVDDGESEHPSDQQIELRPVTVNYAGNELWLFKQHDLDESGDFLLEDLSAAKSSISDLFQACRSSLGDDVSNEHEIGFRFDYLHNLELYEDNTACVAVSLERLVDLYHTLQAQDGVDDPECFYVTLQFRPRFATLLADVAQYAEQGSGYSAFDAAVAAGDTHFSNVFSSASTEHDHVEWDNEENDDEDASSSGSLHSNAPQEAEIGELDESQLEDTQGHEDYQEQKPSHDDAGSDQGVDFAEDLQQDPVTSEEESRAVEEKANIHNSESPALHIYTEQAEVVQEPEAEAVAGRQASESRDERTPDQIAHEKQEADDFVDYSDDEDDQDANSVPANQPSPSSSTVQGDEPAETQEPSIVPTNDSDDEIAAQTGFDEHDDDILLKQTQYGDDANHYAFQNYADTYVEDSYIQGNPLEEFQADSAGGHPYETDDAFNGDTNQDFAEYNFQPLEGDLEFDDLPLEDTNNDHHVDGAFVPDGNTTGAETFLDLDNAPEWAIDADPASNLPGQDAVLVHVDDTAHEDESGKADQSTAADLAPISSNEHKSSSPQGQKRSIDEVGDGVDDAPDSTDAKRLRV